jgi:pentatricopeptide repeat protein
MLARHAFKAADLVSGSPCGVRRIHSLSDHAATSLKGAQHVRPRTLKKNWGTHHEKHTQDSSHSTHKQLGPNMSQCANDMAILQSPSSPQHIPKQLHSLRSNIAQRDASAVLQLWRNFEKDNLLHLLEPSVLKKCSRLVINLCSVEPGSMWSGSTREAAEELALGLANRRFTWALRACFTALITTNDAEGVLRLYNRFLLQTEHRIVFGDEHSLSGEEAQSKLSTIPTIRNAGFSIDQDLSAFAIMAHAIRDDFSSAIRTGIHTQWNFPSVHATNALLDPFAPSSKFRHKVLTFMRHAHAARLFSHPSILYKHLHNMAEGPAAQSLQKLYSTMVEGLSPNYPWATADSESVSDTRPVAIQESTWAAFISAFLGVQRLDLAESVWDDMVRYGQKPGPSVWTALIKGVGRLEGPGPALALWRSMKEAAVTPDSSSYRAIVQVMAETRHWKEAEKLFDEFRSSSFLRSDPNSEPMFKTMISIHLTNSREREAISLLEEMTVNGPHPIAATFNTFLTYYHKQKDVKSFSSMLKKMTANGLSGDIATYSILLCTLLRILDRGEAIQQTLAMMDQHQIKANVATYTAIITSLLQEQEKNALEAALDLLRTMEESANPMIAPNVVTYTAILHGVHSWIGRDDQLVQDCTELMVQKMKARGIKFNRITYHVLLKTCLEISSPAAAQKVLQLYRQMCRENIALNGDTWHIILHGLAKRSEWVVAHEVLRDMQQSGIRMSDWLENVAKEITRGYVVSRQRLASATR